VLLDSLDKQDSLDLLDKLVVQVKLVSLDLVDPLVQQVLLVKLVALVLPDKLDLLDQPGQLE
jgi:hypothetical protein